VLLVGGGSKPRGRRRRLARPGRAAALPRRRGRGRGRHPGAHRRGRRVLGTRRGWWPGPRPRAWAGIEALSGIPGLVGATPVQKRRGAGGAYGPGGPPTRSAASDAYDRGDRRGPPGGGSGPAECRFRLPRLALQGTPTGTSCSGWRSRCGSATSRPRCGTRSWPGPSARIAPAGPTVRRRRAAAAGPARAWSSTPADPGQPGARARSSPTRSSPPARAGRVRAPPRCRGDVPVLAGGARTGSCPRPWLIEAGRLREGVRPPVRCGSRPRHTLAAHPPRRRNRGRPRRAGPGGPGPASRARFGVLLRAGAPARRRLAVTRPLTPVAAGPRGRGPAYAR